MSDTDKIKPEEHIKLLENRIKATDEQLSDLIIKNTERSRKMEFQKREIKKIVEKLKSERYGGDQRYYLRLELDKLIDRFGMTDEEESKLDEVKEESKDKKNEEKKPS